MGNTCSLLNLCRSVAIHGLVPFPPVSRKPFPAQIQARRADRFLVSSFLFASSDSHSGENIAGVQARQGINYQSRGLCKFCQLQLIESSHESAPWISRDAEELPPPSS